MVCVPVAWRMEGDVSSNVIPRLGNLVGGYINPGTYNLSLPFRLLTTKDADHYLADFTTRESYERFCSTLTHTQSVGFQINKEVVEFISEFKDNLVDAGLLMPSCLSCVRITNLRRALPKYLKENGIVDYQFSRLLSILYIRVQRARYERFVF